MTRIGLVQSASLFTRGDESVRIVRVRQPTGTHSLLVNGPGADSTEHYLEDASECARYESELERRLVTRGFRLALFTSGDRRLGTDRRKMARGSDRRRYLERVI